MSHSIMLTNAIHIIHLCTLVQNCRLARLSWIGDGTVAHELNVS